MGLAEKIKDKSATIGIIGLGYVGLPLAVEYADKGFKVLGVDLDQRKIDKIKRGENYIDDVETDKFVRAVQNKKFTAAADYQAVSKMDVIYICVPTPFTLHKDPDNSYIWDSAKEIAKGLRKDQLIILKSTTYPETTEKEVLPILEKTGLKVGVDFCLAFSPERIDPGNKKFTTENTPIVVGGITPRCTEMAKLAIEQVVNHVHTVSSPRVAEMEKLLENIFRSVNIALVNEMARLCDRMGGIDIWEVIDAAATKPFGFMPFYPGPGIGGHCILVDPYYLAWKARAYDFHTRFIELAAESNEEMPFYVIGNIRRALGNVDSSLRKGKVLMLGIAFKKNVDDTRNSPAIKIMELLLQRGVKSLCYSDPYVPKIKVAGTIYESQPLTKELLESQDVVVITADHDAFDAEFIVKHSKAVVDTRNLTKHIKNDLHKIVKLGSGRGFYTDIYGKE
ncbi:MAG: nucleotide sugar dehydrogenase [candidate division KSB1 bacterium]|nr:nucleotide sugar dehydrogenase [candidate division KSB1 bacterium]MDZ7340747.1 nucleotide sugar dehydrogenase [candidate division KSB1 bacterium]